jgi:TonB family protein
MTVPPQCSVTLDGLGYNASLNAPHVAQNLRGDFVFAQNQASVCLFGQNPDELALTVKQEVSAKVDPREVDVVVEPCNPEKLLGYDILATQRNAFLLSKKEDALALIKDIEEDNYRKFAEVTAADLNKSAEAARTQLEKIKDNVADGAPEGFGIVLFKTGSPNLCLAVGAKVPSHRQLLLRAEGKLNLEMQTKVLIKDTTIDDAFINIQKGQCGAVYASAADLKTLTAALARNNTPYNFSSLWTLPADVEQEEVALSEKARIAAQNETERERRNADLAALDAARAKDLSATQAAQQTALRQKFGGSAQVASGALSSEIIAWTKDQSGQIGTFYPAFATWLAEKLTDHWEIVTIDADVQDFGTSNFNTRTLDTIFSKITLHLKNRMLGEYKDSCFIFGRMNDTEFSMWREPAFAQCDDEAAIKAWQGGRQFKSKWFASNSAAAKSDEVDANAPSPPDVTPKLKNDTGETAAPVSSAKAPVGLPLPTIEDLPQYKMLRGIEHSPIAGGNAESRYLTIVYGMIKSNLQATPELHLEMATQHGVVDFYVDDGGNLVGRKLVSSSGSPKLDTAVMAAIAEAAPYPAPPSGRPVSLNYNFGRKAEPIDTPAAPAPIVPSATATAPAVGPAQWQKQTDPTPGGLF